MKVTQKTDLPTILKVQKDSFKEEAMQYDDIIMPVMMPPMVETIEQLEEQFDTGIIFFKYVEEDNIVGSVRAKLENGICKIMRFSVKPGYQNRGIGKTLLRELESYFKNESKIFNISTSGKNYHALGFYSSFGYKAYNHENIGEHTIVHMEKENIQ